MGRYAVDLQRTLSTSASLGNLTAPGASMRRIRIGFLSFGSEATPADAAIQLVAQRCSTTGTRTSVTPAALDAADAACVATAGENHTVEPTYTANTILLNIPVNQRATLQWQAAPGGELVIPATANAGIGLQTPVAPASLGTATLHFEE